MNSFKWTISKEITIKDKIKWEENIIFGTDGEKALIKAIKNCFPNSNNQLYFVHLRKNINLKLTVNFY